MASALATPHTATRPSSLSSSFGLFSSLSFMFVLIWLFWLVLLGFAFCSAFCSSSIFFRNSALAPRARGAGARRVGRPSWPWRARGTRTRPWRARGTRWWAEGHTLVVTPCVTFQLPDANFAQFLLNFCSIFLTHFFPISVWQ